MLDKQNWQFDTKFLQSAYATTTKTLQDKSLSHQQRKMLDDSASQFQSLLSVFEIEPSISKRQKKSVPLFIKKALLEKMRSDSFIISRMNKNFVIDLADSNLFKVVFVEPFFKPEEPQTIVENSLQVYHKFAPSFLPQAKEIINHRYQLVNFSSKKIIGSVCMYNCFLNLPFIEVEKCDVAPCTFIHELQHGIEFMKGYNSYFYYLELGSILFEILYIDEMERRQEDKAELLYFRRFNKIMKSLDYLSSYFKLLQMAEKLDFDMTKSQLITLLQESQLIINEKHFDKRALKILRCDVREKMMYLLSFLKSLEVRNLFYQDQKAGWQYLKNILENKHITYCHSSDQILPVLQSYQEEILIKKRDYMLKKKTNN